MAFRGEMHDELDASQSRFDARGVDDISLDEAIAGVASQVAQIIKIAGVGQKVEIDDFVSGIIAQPITDEIRTDKAGAA